MKKKDRPGKIVLVVITDGQENASEEFSKKDIVKMIKKKEEKGWQFVFLSADLASIDDAAGYGFKEKSTMAYDKSGKGIKLSCASFSNRISEYRRNAKQDVSFDDEDRKKQAAEKACGVKID